MLSRILKSSLKTSLVWRRNCSQGCSKDLVYTAFLDKVREYRLKSPTGKPVDPPPELERELCEALDQLRLKFGFDEGVDVLAFPKLKMPDIDVDPISILELPEYKKMKIDEKDEEEDPKKEAKAKGGAKDTKDKKAKKEDKAKKSKDDKKTKPKDERDKKK